MERERETVKNVSQSLFLIPLSMICFPHCYIADNTLAYWHNNFDTRTLEVKLQEELPFYYTGLKKSIQN